MQRLNTSDTSLIFLLGTQRSGTTWLANILDSSPDTLLFMEPFAPAYGIFPHFPESSFFMERSSPTLDKFLREETLKRLLRYKYLFFQHSLTDPTWFKAEVSISILVSKLGAFVPKWLFDRVQKFSLLNLNRMDKSSPAFRKEGTPSTWIIKELRLAGKIPVLQSAYPDARYVVIIRHPSATVHSILSWFGRNSLGELRHNLDTYLEKIEVQTVAKPYKALIERCRDASLAHKVALYWRISYETMYKKLEDSSRAKFVVYEQLAFTPQETVSDIFSWSQIPGSQSVNDYLIYSTAAPTKPITGITTVRDSAQAYSEWLNKITEPTQQAVEEMTGTSHLMSWFSPYYKSEPLA